MPLLGSAPAEPVVIRCARPSPSVAPLDQRPRRASSPVEALTPTHQEPAKNPRPSPWLILSPTPYSGGDSTGRAQAFGRSELSARGRARSVFFTSYESTWIGPCWFPWLKSSRARD